MYAANTGGVLFFTNNAAIFVVHEVIFGEAAGGTFGGAVHNFGFGTDEFDGGFIDIGVYINFFVFFGLCVCGGVCACGVRG